MKIIANIETKTFTKEDTMDYENPFVVYFGFCNNEKTPVTFDNLGFGYSLFLMEEKISEKSFPPEGIVYVYSDQEYIECFSFQDIAPEKEYFIKVWCRNSEEEWEESYAFSMPRPEQPFDSWIYNEESFCWNPPVSYPADGENYVWNEENQSWIPLAG
jgi:hypothetical protein